jgi:large repetitive protein
MPGRRSCLLTVLATVSGFLVATGVGESALAATADLVNEPFTSPTTTSANWVLPAASVSETNTACLTASSNTSQTPIPGCAATAGVQPGLQLTTNALTQEGGLAYSSSVPSSHGLDVVFNTYQYSGTAADGIVFYLAASDPTNASASPITLGQPGGYLGYAGNAGSAAGLTRGYLGIGLDVFGNYTNPGFDGSGCTNDPTSGKTPESVTVRGPGNGTAGYCMLSTSLAGGTLDSSTPQAVPVEVAVNPTASTLTAAGGFSVAPNSYEVQWTPIGATTPLTESGTLPNASAFVPDSSWVDGNGVPQQLSFGWSASTGANTDYHTISGVDVRTLNGTPPTLAVGLIDNSGGNARTSPTPVTYTATTTLSGTAEMRPITLTDTFPTGLVPQTSGLGGTGWNCGVVGQVVTCTSPPPTSIGTLPTVAMPVLVSIPAGSPPVSLTDSATAGAPDATQGTGTDTETYAPAPTATVLSITGQPVDTQVNTAMKNADNTTTHVLVAADVTAGGAVDTTYTGNVTLSFGTNPGGASFVVGGNPTPTITVAAVSGVADFSPIIVNAVGTGYTLTASATGLTSATSTPFTVAAAATSCPTGQTCTVTTTSTGGQSAAIQAQAGTGNAIITATFGGNVVPVHPCTGATTGVLTFSGSRQKVITLTLPIKQLSLVFCYGQPTPFLDILYRPVTYFNPINQEYEGLLPLCLPKFTGPCVKSLSLTKTSEIVVVQSGTADPRLMG